LRIPGDLAGGFGASRALHGIPKVEAQKDRDDDDQDDRSRHGKAFAVLLARRRFGGHGVLLTALTPNMDLRSFVSTAKLARLPVNHEMAPGRRDMAKI
jgi:hypothetical protein